MIPHDNDLDEPTVVGHRPSALQQPTTPRAFSPPPPPPPPPPPFGATGAPPPLSAAGAQPPFGRAPARSPNDFPVTGLSSPAPATPRQSEEAAAPGTPGRTTLQLVDEPASPEDVIVAAAVPLLLVVAQLRDAVEFAEVETLRNEVIKQVQRFEERAVKFEARPSDVMAARYVLCSLIDEAVMTTPWGSASNWSTNSLLNRFHNETWGGEKVFSILTRIKTDAKNNIALLKLIDMALLLGFEGMHRVVDGGRERLADLRDEVGSLVVSHSTPPAAELSANWRGYQETRSLRGYLPLWMVFAFTAFFLVATYGIMKYQVTSDMAPIEEQIKQLGLPGTPGMPRP